MMGEEAAVTMPQHQDQHRDHSLFCRTGAYLRDFDVENKPWQHEQHQLHSHGNNDDFFTNMTSTGYINVSDSNKNILDSSKNVTGSNNNDNDRNAIDNNNDRSVIDSSFPENIDYNSSNPADNTNSKVIINENSKDRFIKTREMWEKKLMQTLKKNKDKESTAPFGLAHHERLNIGKSKRTTTDPNTGATESLKDKAMRTTPPFSIEYDSSNNSTSSSSSTGSVDDASYSSSSDSEWVDLDEDPPMQSIVSGMCETKSIHMTPKYITKSKQGCDESFTEQNTLTEDNTSVTSDSFSATSFGESADEDDNNNDTNEVFIVTQSPSSQMYPANTIDNRAIENTATNTKAKTSIDEKNVVVNNTADLIEELRGVLSQRNADSNVASNEPIMEWYTDEDMTLLESRVSNNKSLMNASNIGASTESLEASSNGSLSYSTDDRHDMSVLFNGNDKFHLERDERSLHIDEIDKTTSANALSTFDQGSSAKDINDNSEKHLQRDERSLHVDEVDNAAPGNVLSTFDKGVTTNNINDSMRTNDTESDSHSDSDSSSVDLNRNNINIIKEDKVSTNTVPILAPAKEKDEIAHITLDELLDELVHRDDDVDTIFSDPFERERSYNNSNNKNTNTMYTCDALCLYPIGTTQFTAPTLQNLPPSPSVSPSSSYSRHQLIDAPVQTWFGCEQLPESFIAANAADEGPAVTTSKFTLYQNARPLLVQPLLAEDGQSVGGFQVGEKFYV